MAGRREPGFIYWLMTAFCGVIWLVTVISLFHAVMDAQRTGIHESRAILNLGHTAVVTVLFPLGVAAAALGRPLPASIVNALVVGLTWAFIGVNPIQ